MTQASLDTVAVRREFFAAEHVVGGHGAPERAFARALVGFAVGVERVDAVRTWSIDWAAPHWFVEVDGDLYVYDATDGECELLSRPCDECSETGVVELSRGPVTWTDFCDCTAGESRRDAVDCAAWESRSEARRGWH